MKRLALLFLAISLFSSCRVFNPSVMFKTEKGYPFAQFDSTARITNSEYKLADYDEIGLFIYTNDGYKLVDVTTGGSAAQAGGQITYKIEKDGLVKLPQLGRVALKGYTVREAEKVLEEKFSMYFNKPFVVLNVVNRKIYVFNGEGGNASIITMTSDNMTLVEAIAQAGGVKETGKAYKIKLIRGDLKNPKIYLLDLSTVEGMKAIDMQMQSNDIIYIEPTRNIAASILTQISPLLGLISTVVLAIALVNK